MSESSVLDNVVQEWGLRAPEGYNGVRWGARAIFNTRGEFQTVKKGRKHIRYERVYVPRCDIDIPWDRQSLTGGTDAERKALADWVNESGMAALKKELVKQSIDNTCDATVTVRGKGYVLSASPRGSHGYLYIGCYKEPV